MSYPQQPNPYGQGGAPGQPGYGYPQQPQAPYGAPQPPQAPQAPYGAPPQQGGWSAPQPPGPYGNPNIPQQPGMPGGYPPPPPQGGGKGKAIGITVAAVVAVGAVVAGAVFFLNGGSDSVTTGGSGEVKPYTIVLPDTLLEGKFTKAPTPAGQQNQPKSIADAQEAKEMGIENGTSISGGYTNAEKQTLGVGGAYGTVADPKKTVDAVIAKDEKQRQSLNTKAKVEVVTPWTDFSPSGFDGAVMKCRTQKSTYSIGTMSSTAEVSSCIWGDKSAIGVIQHVVSKTSGGFTGGAGGPTGNVMSAKELSEATVKIRNEVRKEQ
ncbi:hypothetical protein GCM10010218_16300 [Streptomyces mashuensis]|uniref:Uncharacterized protein n=1 Tax=Streptomyces mashuensis TaxID=33904 RepID=A0A919EC37_9ACTN|nr:hypothetical protein [Streptomyces mashuensis]GHF35676.1 hypothetical protein GCM10010218_16300 [Streptomyces mashuensis]